MRTTGTSCIDPFVYAVFLKALLFKIIQLVPKDGILVQVWKRESEVTFDAETFGDDEDEDGTEMKDDDDGRSGNGGPTERTRGGTERRMGTRHPGKPQRNRGNRRGTERDRGQSKRRGKSYKAMARARVKKMYAANQIQTRVRSRVAKKRAEKGKFLGIF